MSTGGPPTLERLPSEVDPVVARAAGDDFLCCLCFELLVAPVTTECGHSFCRHCLTRVLNEDQTSLKGDEIGRCPVCRSEFTEHLRIDDKLVRAMETAAVGTPAHALLSTTAGDSNGNARSNTPNRTPQAVPEGHLFLRARMATLNPYDNNLTSSWEFFLNIRPDGTCNADIVWGGGSAHSTYNESTCRLGQAKFDAATGWLRVGRSEYSNGPWEEYRIRMVATTATTADDTTSPDRREQGQTGCNTSTALATMVGVEGLYKWHGWNNRRTWGHLMLETVPREQRFTDPPGGSAEWLARRHAAASSHGVKAEYKKEDRIWDTDYITVD
eukprot:TRINITY_DN92850_c0_g1_i1.p1 TRINITY_DN92850_c0_g1~~TRINITY_DN92850_c0_g1_i1.p1  ORF type:complete len:328 (+),score=14.85 TRINITY_DN92850_c0_g1_i1:120-1103(+)